MKERYTPKPEHLLLPLLATVLLSSCAEPTPYIIYLTLPAPTSTGTPTPPPTETPTPQPTNTIDPLRVQSLHGTLEASRLIRDSLNDETYVKMTSCPPRDRGETGRCAFYSNYESSGYDAPFDPFAVFWWGDWGSYAETFTDAGSPVPPAYEDYVRGK